MAAGATVDPDAAGPCEDSPMQEGIHSRPAVGSLGHPGYRADIDGLRALAVLAVVLFHAGCGVPGGFVGVDVFFVISGYLITGLVAADLDRGRFSLVDFWNRRLRRIWPAALAVTISVLVAGWVIMLPDDLRVLAADAVAQVTMLANVRFWKGTDYFDPSVDLRPLLHTWSLAVEEQFYLVFPPVMVLLSKLGSRTRLGILAVLAAASLAASVVMIGPRPMAVFYLLPFRAWEMLLGAVLALVPWSGPATSAWRQMLALGGLIAIVVPCFRYGRETVFPAAAALPPCLGAVALLAAGEQTWVNRLLAVEPLRQVGLMSYSLYLWHWPILAFLRYCLDLSLPAPVTVAALVATTLLAGASYRWVETPFRRGWPARFPGRFALAVAMASGVVVATAFVVRRLDGLPGRFTPQARRLFDAGAFSHEWAFEGDITKDVGRSLKSMGKPGGTDRACFLFWGDSHAMCISPAIDALAGDLGISGRAALGSGLIPLPLVERRSGQGCREWRAWQAEIMRWIREYRPRHVILCARWSMYAGVKYPDCGLNANMVTGSVVGRQGFLSASGGKRSQPEAEAIAAIRRGVEALLSVCDSVDATLWFLLEVPYQAAAARHGILTVHWLGVEPSFAGVDRKAHAERVAPVREALTGCDSARLRVIDLAEPLFDADGVSRVGAEGRFWYWDHNHINTTGARDVLAPVLRDMLEEIAADCGGL